MEKSTCCTKAIKTPLVAITVIKKQLLKKPTVSTSPTLSKFCFTDGCLSWFYTVNVNILRLKENSHQILKLVERKIQGLVSSCRKPTVQTAIEAENQQRVVQTIPRMYAKSYSLEATTFGFGYKSQLDTICLTILTLKCAQISVFLANQQSELRIRHIQVLNTSTKVIFNALFLRYGKLLQ